MGRGTGHGLRIQAVDRPRRSDQARSPLSDHESDPPDGKAVAEIQLHLEFLRATARRCTGDDELAKDLVQDAALAVLSSQGGPVRDSRGWLFVVIQRLAHRHRRTEQRRRQREVAAAQPDVVESPSEAIAHRDERGQLVRSVLRALRDLPSPYREMVRLRYLRQIPPRQIAKHLGIPTATVKTRLVRGLRMLRVAMEQPGSRRD